MLYHLQIGIITGAFTLCIHPSSLLWDAVVNNFSKKVMTTKLFADHYIWLRGFNKHKRAIYHLWTPLSFYFWEYWLTQQKNVLLLSGIVCYIVLRNSVKWHHCYCFQSSAVKCWLCSITSCISVNINLTIFIIADSVALHIVYLYSMSMN